jgi:hypothetical protein
MPVLVPRVVAFLVVLPRAGFTASNSDEPALSSKVRRVIGLAIECRELEFRFG